MSPFFSPFRKSAGGKMYHSFWGEALFSFLKRKRARGKNFFRVQTFSKGLRALSSKERAPILT